MIGDLLIQLNKLELKDSTWLFLHNFTLNYWDKKVSDKQIKTLTNICREQLNFNPIFIEDTTNRDSVYKEITGNRPKRTRKNRMKRDLKS